jgi:hypothetical protein
MSRRASDLTGVLAKIRLVRLVLSVRVTSIGVDAEVVPPEHATTISPTRSASPWEFAVGVTPADASHSIACAWATTVAAETSITILSRCMLRACLDQFAVIDPNTPVVCFLPPAAK